MATGQEKDILESYDQLQAKSASFYQKKALDSAYYYAKSSYKLAQKTGEDSLIINSLIQLIKTSSAKDKEIQKEYYEEALKRIQPLENNNKLIELYFAQGEHHFDQ